MKILTPAARDLEQLSEAQLEAKWRTLPEAQKEPIAAEIQRIKRLAAFTTPGLLAQALDPLTVQTPALDLVDSKLVEVGQAVESMYERRARMHELITGGADEQEAVEQAALDIPSRGTGRLIIVMAFQEGKSSRVSRHGVEWLLMQFPELRIPLISYDGVNANRISYQIRGDIELFDGVGNSIDLGLRLKADQKAMGRWMLTTGGGVYAIGMGGGLTGHPSDLGVIDDPIKDLKAAESDVQIRYQGQWYYTTFRPRLAPWAPVVIVTTRWSDDDLVGQLTGPSEHGANPEGWQVVTIPAQADHDPAKGESDVLGREPGEFMVSARGRTEAQWEDLKANTPERYWQTMYQGRPTPAGGIILLRQWWRRYDEPLWTRQLDGSFRVNGYELTQSWDLTFKDNKTSDYVVGALWAKKGSESFLVYVMRSRLNFTATLDAMRRMNWLFPQARRKLVEDKANGPAIISSLKKEIPGIIAVQVSDSKTARAESITPYLRAGNILIPTVEAANVLPELAFDVEAFLDEHTAFPRGANLDQVDTTTQYIREVYITHSEASVHSPVGRGTSAKQPESKSVMAQRLAQRKA